MKRFSSVVVICSLVMLLSLGSFQISDAQQSRCSSMITSRAEWGARSPRSTLTMKLPVQNVLIHHSETPTCTTPSTCANRIKSIQNYHMKTNGWDDIGYSFLIGGDGKIYEGRGWNKVGTHSPGYNGKSIGICLIGSFENFLPPKHQLDAVKKLLECGRRNHLINRNYRLYGHRDVRHTSCPGKRLYTEISTWPHKAPPLKHKY